MEVDLRLERVGLADAVDFCCGFEGSAGTTVFAPRNRAFKKLPVDLRTYLFAPAGRRALEKLLRFHIIPGLVLQSGAP